MQLRDMRGVLIMQTGERQQARFSSERCVPLVQRSIELFVEHPHFQELHIGKFQHGSHVVHLVSKEHGGVPVNEGGISNSV